MKKKSTTIILVFLISVLSLFSQEFDKEKMDQLFDRIVRADMAMGTVSLSKDGKEIYSRSLGFIDVEKSIKADKKSRYRIGSISKTYTATIILQLVQEGKLKLETTLDKYYSKIANSNKITIEHLLQHRSGLVNFTSLPDYTSYMEKAKSHDELIEMFIKNGNTFEPGAQYQYSNTNYVLLSFIIEKIENKSFAESLDSRIVKFLNLKNTFYGKTINSKNGDAYSYDNTGKWTKSTETDMSIPTGAGAIVSTANEVNIFLHALLHEKLINKELLGKMMTMKDNYGYGMIVFPFNGRSAYGHTGGIDNFVANAAHFNKENFTVSLLTNGLKMNMNNMLIGILSIYFAEDYDLPTFEKAIELSADELNQYIGVYGSSTFPLKITIAAKGSILTAQATGQASFTVDALGNNKFKKAAYGIDFEFFPKENKMIFIQGGQKFELMKE